MQQNQSSNCHKEGLRMMKSLCLASVRLKFIVLHLFSLSSCKVEHTFSIFLCFQRFYSSKCSTGSLLVDFPSIIIWLSCPIFPVYRILPILILYIYKSTFPWDFCLTILITTALDPATVSTLVQYSTNNLTLFIGWSIARLTILPHVSTYSF